PPYPRVARQRGWEGTVRLEVFVSKDGIPGTVGIDKSSGHDVLDRAALQTVREWKFIPARSGSIRFSSRITIPIQFSLIKERP
ncbi:MAG: energy transducer TonB, partial [Candidatus Omnitrophica bacterium]|nr:energy transducer TonB [Candidatus Omnitrophota bacterium]